MKTTAGMGLGQVINLSKSGYASRRTQGGNIFRRFLLLAFMIVLANPVVVSAAQIKDLAFANGTHLQQSIYSIWWDGFLHRVYWKTSDDKIGVVSGTNVAFFEQSDKQNLPTFSAVIVDGKTMLVDQDGDLIRTGLLIGTNSDWTGSSLISDWSGVEVQNRGQRYFAISLRYKKGDGETYLIRASDGAANRINSTYSKLTSENVLVADDHVQIAAKQLLLAPLELNAGFIKGPQYRGGLAVRAPPSDSGLARLSQLNRSNIFQDKLFNALSAKVFGQEAMIQKLSMLYATSTVQAMTRPLVAVLTGPTGVGKSYVAREFAKQVFTSDQFFLEIDGNEYKAPIQGGNIEHHKLFGAPLGQQGRQKGILTEWLKKTKGDGVLVINEADKMSPDMWLRFMELFDTGKTRDGSGFNVKSRNLYIILTSNRGTKVLFPDAVKDWSEEELQKYAAGISSEKVQEAYRTTSGPDDKFQLPDEVLARVDAFITAIPLTLQTAKKIVRAAAVELMDTAKTEYDVYVNIGNSVIDQIATTGFSNIKSGRLISRQSGKIFEQLLLQMSKAWRVRKNETIDVKLTFDEKNHAQITSTYKGQSISTPAPREDEKNPLRDPDLVNVINNFPAALKTRVVGQDEVLKSVGEILTAQYSDQFRTRPASLYLIGSTGTGKTETARAIAFARYGSDKRAVVIPFGKVHTEGAFNSIFGVEPGYEGSREERLFEKALKANPNGGVIVFDEISNMGGGNKELKHALFTKLYDMIEEGKWTSPISPDRVYDLSKYTFIFTGNDGENLFQNITADDLRMNIWNDNKDTSKVRKLLSDAGVPEAFINRMAEVFLMKPLMRHEIGSIVNKMTNDKTREWEEQHTGARITFAPNFKDDLGKIFFSQDQGGRSVRKVLDDRITALINGSLIKVGAYPTGSTEGLEIHLSISDNKSKRPYRRKNSPVRKVELHVTISRNGSVIYEDKLDATKQADFSLILDPQRAAQVAFHEASHAVMNIEKVTGEQLAFITLYGGRAQEVEYLGYARYEPIPNLTMLQDRDSVLMHIAQLSAGRIGQNMAGFSTDQGWSNDLEKIRKIATNYLTKWGDKELRGLPLDKDGNVDMSDPRRKLFDEKYDQLLAEAEVKATTFLKAHWSLVRTISAELLIKGTINGARYKELKEFSMKNERPDIGHRNWTYEQFVQEEQRRRAGRGTGPSQLCEDLFINTGEHRLAE